MTRGMRFETYPPMFSDYEKGIENENYDNEVLVFVVPEDWFRKWLEGYSIREFLEEWTWDAGLNMHSDATKDGVLIAEWIELRDYRDYQEEE